MANDVDKKSSVPSFPVEDILSNVASSVVEAQRVLDQSSLRSELRIRDEGLDKYGLKAHWYTIPELDFELRLAFELDSRGEMKSQMVDAEYQNKYGFNVKASSLLETKIVATPPPDTEGLSLLEKDFVLKRMGQIKKIVEAYDRSEAPYFVIRYRPFVRQGYDGGLWYVFLMDTLVSNEKVLRGMAVIDDFSTEVLRLWSDEPIILLGVTFSAKEAYKALTLINSADEAVLKDEIGLSARGVDGILTERPFNDLVAVGTVPYVGTGSIEKLRDYVSNK